MKYTPPNFANLAEMSYIDVCRLTEDEARGILEKIRWPEGIICVHCGSKNIGKVEAVADSVRDGLLQCKDCRNQFTVTVGTVMQGSHITLRQWVQAFHAMCASKKGISALQLQRNLGLKTYKSAWHLAHRVRFAMEHGDLKELLKGTVEVDETYIGGKPRKGARDGNGDLIINKRGRGTKKVPVVALISRNGNMFTKVVDVVDAKNLKEAIQENVSKRATLMTDELPAYNKVGYKKHKTVNHSEGQYALGNTNVNSCESFFALLKRGVHGTFHHISKKHLSRYCNEFSFRWDNRKVTDGERMVEAVKGAFGKRLTYRPLVQGV
jgi:transposase-like protein